jgi:hypothetical protein
MVAEGCTSVSMAIKFRIVNEQLNFLRQTTDDSRLVREHFIDSPLLITADWQASTVIQRT